MAVFWLQKLLTNKVYNVRVKLAKSHKSSQQIDLFLGGKNAKGPFFRYGDRSSGARLDGDCDFGLFRSPRRIDRQRGSRSGDHGGSPRLSDGGNELGLRIMTL